MRGECVRVCCVSALRAAAAVLLLKADCRLAPNARSPTRLPACPPPPAAAAALLTAITTLLLLPIHPPTHPTLITGPTSTAPAGGPGSLQTTQQMLRGTTPQKITLTCRLL
jgi:hypothetical protein